MFVRASEAIAEPSIHKTPKQVFLRYGVIPGITQVATASLEAGVEIEPHAHPTMYEIYYMLAGRAVYHVGDEDYAVGHFSSAAGSRTSPALLHRTASLLG